MSLESAESKIEEICEKLRKETLDPARAEAHLIIESATKRAEEIVEEARRKAEEIQIETKKDFKEQLSVHEVSLDLAIKKALAKLKQEVMQIFNKELEGVLAKEMGKTEVVAAFLNALVEGIKKEGMQLDIQAILPKALSIDALFPLLAKEVQESLQKEQIQIGNFSGGVSLKLVNQKMVIDISDKALKEILIAYTSEELREKIFKA